MKLLKNITLNLILGLNVFILFFLLAEGRIVIPPALQVLGRMHPLLLHFPIVLLFLALVFEVFNGYLNEDSTPSAVKDPGSSKTSPAGRNAEIGRAHVYTPVTNAHLACRITLEKKKENMKITHKQLYEHKKNSQ